MIVKFIPASLEVEEVVDYPKPIKLTIPDWYKKSQTFDVKDIEFDKDNKVKNKGLKTCIPFFDAMSSGYTQVTWTDIHVQVENNSIVVRTASGPEILQTREKVNLPIEDLFYPIEFVWKMPWLPKLPKGYSMLLTHPMNRTDLPFMSLSGLVDSDAYYHTSFGNFPFYIKKNFTGIIPQGTPMYQMIPIKRDSWTSKQVKFDEKDTRKRNSVMEKFFYGAYKRIFWNKKEYQ